MTTRINRQLLAKDFMTGNPVHILTMNTVEDALRVLDSYFFRHLPVLDENESVVGILSDRDLLAFDIYNTDPKSARVAQVMSAPAQTITPQETLVQAAEVILQHGVGALPVVDDGKLAGMLSYVDILRAFVEQE